MTDNISEIADPGEGSAVSLPAPAVPTTPAVRNLSPRKGAIEGEWDYFKRQAHEDLLPGVGNQSATISPGSKLKPPLGKTPSRYNSRGHVAGIANWTAYHATEGDITNWSRNPDYNICLQTRMIRALDCDIEDAALAQDIYDEIAKHARLPVRRRATSTKFLLAFRMPGDFPKRTIHTSHGIIEFLGTGQQCVVAGTHPSGSRYEWGDLPNDIPTLTPEQFEALWARLIERFAVEAPAERRPAVPSRDAKLADAAQRDPVARTLDERGLVISQERDGRLHIICPFFDEHTSDTSESATTYFPAFTGGYEGGHFHCLHAHCANRSDSDFLDALGINPVFDDFDDLTLKSASIVDAPAPVKPARYEFEYLRTALAHPDPEYIVEGVLPRGEIGVMFGSSKGGKTFLAIDLAGAIARGAPWRERPTKQGAVGIIAAEDAQGVRLRVKAYLKHNKLEPDEVPLAILDAEPNLTKPDDVRELIAAVQERGPFSVIFVDTLARSTAGADENSAKDVGVALAGCKALHRATGAMIVLIHHSGKDESKGARGSTALIGAADVEIEVTRFAGEDDSREARITKLKNGPDGDRFGFTLLPVVVGETSTGDDITSCVVEHTAAKAQRGARELKGVVEKVVMRVVGDLTVGGPVAVADLIESAVKGLAHDPEKRDRRRDRVLRALNTLTERSWLVIEGGNVSLAGER